MCLARSDMAGEQRGTWIDASQNPFCLCFLFNYMLLLDKEAILFVMNMQSLWGAPPLPDQGEASGPHLGKSHAMGVHGWKIIWGLSAAELEPKTYP